MTEQFVSGATGTVGRDEGFRVSWPAALDPVRGRRLPAQLAVVDWS